MTERVGLFGWPLGHSVSSPMHNAAFKALDMDWRYELFPVAPENFETTVAQLTEVGCRGFNVTIPHKQAAFRLPQVATITPAARAIQAVNTLSVQPDGTLAADNTDWAGFAADLAQHEITVHGARCLVLGTGGSAQAVRYALEQAGAVAVIAVSRNPEARPDVIGYAALPDIAPGIDVVINCTPVGMSPHVEQTPWPEQALFPPGAVLYDLVYNPPVTRFMVQVQNTGTGARAVGGLGMLVWQGALAFETWTGIAPPVDVMFAAANRMLNEA